MYARFAVSAACLLTAAFAAAEQGRSPADAIDNDDLPAPAKGEGVLVRVSPSREVGPIKPMNAANNGPNFVYDGEGWHDGRFDDYRALNVPMVRTHDSRAMVSPPGRINDLALVFPNFDADENDPRNYDFDLTDLNLNTIRLAGAEIMYCLGSSCDGIFKNYGTDEPPKDPAKWARIAANIIRHYNEGWGWSNAKVAFSNQFNVTYWEIWNEPDLDVTQEYWETGKRTWERRRRYWNGSPEQFFDFYTTVARQLKATFPDLRFGGPSLAGHVEWAKRFLEHCAKNRAPLDFFSWHAYQKDPMNMVRRATAGRKLLDQYGFGATESILNEWNWNCGWNGDAFRQSIAERVEPNNYRIAAFYAVQMCALQHAPLDMLMYYDLRLPSQYNGLFSAGSERPLKGYYAFYAWSRLRRLGQEVASAVTGDDAGVWSVAARGRNGALAVCVARYTLDSGVLDSVPVRLAVDGRRLESARLHLTDALERYTEKVLRVRADGTADFRLAPNAFAVIELEER